MDVQQTFNPEDEDELTYPEDGEEISDGYHHDGILCQPERLAELTNLAIMLFLRITRPTAQYQQHYIQPSPEEVMYTANILHEMVTNWYQAPERR